MRSKAVLLPFHGLFDFINALRVILDLSNRAVPYAAGKINEADGIFKDTRIVVEGVTYYNICLVQRLCDHFNVDLKLPMRPGPDDWFGIEAQLEDSVQQNYHEQLSIKTARRA